MVHGDVVVLYGQHYITHHSARVIKLIPVADVSEGRTAPDKDWQSGKRVRPTSGVLLPLALQMLAISRSRVLQFGLPVPIR